MRFGLEPTAGDYDFAQFVRTGDTLVLNLTAPILQLVRHTQHTRHTDASALLTFRPLRQGTYYLGVFGNTSCTYSVKAFAHSTPPHKVTMRGMRGC